MKKFIERIGRTFKSFWNAVTLCRRFIGNLIFLVVIIFLLSLFLFNSGTQVPQGAALILSPKGDIVEQTTEIMPVRLLLSQSPREETLLEDIIDGIDYAKDDKKIKALVLDLDEMAGAGLSKLQDIGAALKRFKDSDKIIIAVGDNYSQNQYYIAAYADQIYLHPMGRVGLMGYALYRKYIKSALEKIMVEFHVFSAGTYKSVLEPFLRNDMSEAAREANAAWLNTLWQAYKTDVAAQRGLKTEHIDDYINNLVSHLAKVKGDTARLAIEQGLVDALKTRDQVRDELIGLVGEDKKGKTYKQIEFNDYLRIIRPSLDKADPETAKVGIIVAKGIIRDGRQPAGMIGGDSIAELIRQARNDDQIKSIVLRIDSGGGSAFASEVIRREVELTRRAGKPVVASMGSVAASGGYWIATFANEIWASPTTLTGSIGIFSAFPTFDKTLKHLGINTDGVATTQLAGAFDPTRPLNPSVADAMQQVIEQGYQRFIETVSKGRNMSPSDVEKAAQGRVWSGKTALKLGLVDKLGNLKDAIESAATLADLDDYGVINLVRPLTMKELILKILNRLIYDPFADSRFADNSPFLRFYSATGIKPIAEIVQLNDPQGLNAYCLNCDVR
jgi:protease-4